MKDETQEKITKEDLAIYANLGNNKIHIELKNSITEEERKEVINSINLQGKSFHSICDDKVLLSMGLDETTKKLLKDGPKDKKDKLLKETYDIDCEIDYIFEYDSPYVLTIENIIDSNSNVRNNIRKSGNISEIYKKEREKYVKKINNIERNRKNKEQNRSKRQSIFENKRV